MERNLTPLGSKLAIIAIVLFVLLFFGSFFGCSFNKMVRLDENVQTSWSQVENQYQRRADLIPNLVSTVKGYAAHEEKTLTEVIEARAKATQTTISADNLTPEALDQFSAAQSELGSALSRLMVAVERYPELKANDNFLMLQAQLEGTENRITVERQRFNETANKYNRYIRRFPKNLLAKLFGFEKRPYFEATKEAQEAPQVQF